MEAAQLLSIPGTESPLEISLVRGTRGHKRLIINNYLNSELSDSGDTFLMLGFFLLEEGISVICGAAVSGGSRVFMSSMYEYNTTSHT